MTKERSQILIRKTCLVAFDILSVIIAFFLSSIIAYNGHIELSFLRYSYYLLSGLIVSLWRYASVNELLNVIIASFLSTIVYCILCTICPMTPPISTVFLYLLILLMLVGGARFGYRFLRLYASRHHLLGRGEHIESRVMIIGAGSAGEKILRETLVTPKINKEVVCFIDVIYLKKEEESIMYLLLEEEMKSCNKLKNIM